MSISFPNPGDPGYTDANGISCEIYSYGFTSGCTDDFGNNRGFTQEWYFDEIIGAWVAVTTNLTVPTNATGDIVFVDGAGGFSGSPSLNFSDGRLSITGDVTRNVNEIGLNLSPTNTTFDISFVTSNIHYISYNASSNTVHDTIKISNPPADGSYGEIKLIVKNPANPSTLHLRGLNISGSEATVNFDKTLSGSTSSLTGPTGTHMWKVWTIDGGSNYNVYKVNGQNRYWD
tara:strand:+ start:344 stop:1036 length:693 start_codon:yes stop_codon:yes gene_type:complete